MKVSIARIRLILKTGKKLADGSHPIMLSVAFNGKKMISTGYSCTEKYWDKSTESVKKGYPNFAMINAYIHSLKNECIERRNEYERQGKPYTADMLLVKREILSGSSMKIEELYKQCVAEKGLKPNTVKNWKLMYNQLSEFSGKDIILTQIDVAFVKRFAAYLKSEKKLKDSSIREALGKIGALQRWAIEKGLVDEKDYVFRQWSFRGRYTSDRNLKYIHPRTLPFLKDYLLDLVVNRDIVERHIGDWFFKRTAYKDGVLTDLRQRHTSLFSIYFYSFGMTMNGISPVDLCLLKKDDLKTYAENGKTYWSIDYRREKTGKIGRIRLNKTNMWNSVLVETMLRFNKKNDYLLPVLDERYKSIDKMKMAIQGNLELLNKKLKVHWKKINLNIIKHNWINKDNVPLIDDNISMYSYRHTFAMHYIMNGGNPLALATMLGHSNSMKAMTSYIALLRQDSDLVDNLIEIGQ